VPNVTYRYELKAFITNLIKRNKDMSNMTKKAVLPTNEEIQSRTQHFSERAERVISGVEKINVKETLNDKLFLIRKQLLLFKDKKVPYTTIQQLIKEEFNLVVSDFTLRKFCQNELGFSKKTNGSHQQQIDHINTPNQTEVNDSHYEEDLDVFDSPIEELMPKENLQQNFDAKSALSNTTSDFE